MDVEDESKLEYTLRGKAWKVYWLLLKSGRPMSVREVQKALHFSSPSVAQHHLEQLREWSLGGLSASGWIILSLFLLFPTILTNIVDLSLLTKRAELAKALDDSRVHQPY